MTEQHWYSRPERARMGIKRLIFSDGSAWDVQRVGGLVVRGLLIPEGEHALVKWSTVQIGKPVEANATVAKVQWLSPPLMDVEIVK